WLLYRYDPSREMAGMNPLQIDSRKPKLPVQRYMAMENRFKMLMKSKPDVAQTLAEAAQGDSDYRWAMYEYLASRSYATEIENDDADNAGATKENGQ
ncbi:MAG: hypothetical protein AAF125_25530, partial [Chloroflexota bacterium]